MKTPAKRPLATADNLDVDPTILIGESTLGSPIVADPTETMILVSGSTGSGKTTLARWVCTELARVGYQLVIVNPKYVGYECLAPIAEVVTDPAEMVKVFQANVDEMEKRYRRMAAAGISEFVPTLETPRIALVVEEVAALTATSSSKKDKDATLQLITRFANMARGAGMLLFLVTQSPDSKTIDTSTRASCGIRIGARNGSEQWQMLIGADEEAEIRSRAITRPGEVLVYTPESFGWVQGRSFYLSEADVAKRARAIAERRGFPKAPGFMDFDRGPDVPA